MRYAKWFGGILLMALLLSRPQAAAYGAARAMARWYEVVAPSLFPFLALLPLLTGEAATSVYERLLGHPMNAILGLPGAAAPAIIIGMVAGTPAGAVSARSIAARSGMKQGQLQRVAIAMTGFSPAFLIGGVGAGMLGSAGAGWRLLFAQMATQLTMAMLLSRAWRSRTQPVAAPDRREEESPVRGAVLVILSVCGYMALFGGVACALQSHIGRSASNALLCLLDVPSGATLVAGSAMAEDVKLVLLAAMCGFGGACVIAQSLGVLKGCGVKPWEYFALRILASGISAGYMVLLLKLSGLDLSRWTGALRANPMAAAGLVASLLALPPLLKMRKPVS